MHRSDPVARLRRLRVLVVDDQIDCCLALVLLVESLGHDARYTIDPTQAFALFLDYAPDVAFLDLTMPGLTGWDVAMQIRAARGGQSIHLVAISGLCQPADKERSVQAGFDQHWVKPMEMARLESLLKVIAADSGT